MANQKKAIVLLKDETVTGLVKSANLKHLEKAENDILDLIKQNAFIEPNCDNIEDAEKRRKNLKAGRTTVQNDLKKIKKTFSVVSKTIETFGAELIAISEPVERKQESANKLYIEKIDYNKAITEGTKEALKSYIDKHLILYKNKEAYLPFRYEEVIAKINIIEEQQEKEKEEFETWNKELLDEINIVDSSDNCKQIIASLEGLDIPENYTFRDEKHDKRNFYLEMCDNKLAVIKQNEEEQAEIKAEKERQEKAQKEIEKQKAELEINNLKMTVTNINFVINNVADLESITKFKKQLNLFDVGKIRDDEVIKMHKDCSVNITKRRLEIEQEIKEKKEKEKEEFNNCENKIKAFELDFFNKIKEATVKNIDSINSVIKGFKIEINFKELLSVFTIKKEKLIKLAELRKAEIIEEAESKRLLDSGRIKIDENIFEIKEINEIEKYYKKIKHYFTSLPFFRINEAIKQMSEGKQSGKIFHDDLTTLQREKQETRKDIKKHLSEYINEYLMKSESIKESINDKIVTIDELSIWAKEAVIVDFNKKFKPSFY